MQKFLIGEWTEIKRLWSIWIGVIGTVSIASIPYIADQWPSFAPALVEIFPKNGEQWVPVIGGVIAIIARLIDQKSVMNVIKQTFKKQE